MNNAKLIFAANYAARHHRQQRRKGTGDVPYVNHVLDVAARLEAAHPDDPILITAGLLHDIVEDCADWSETTGEPTPDDLRNEIAALFGAEVLGVVNEVTDDKRLAKEDRKTRQVAEVGKKSIRAKRLKLADKASNITAIADTPPDWPIARKRAYLDWAEAVVAGARGVSETLEAEFDAAVLYARNKMEA